MLGIGSLHLVCVARLSSFAALAYSYALLVCPYSPRWPNAPTCCSFDLVFTDLHSDVWQERRARHHWPTSPTCCSSALILHAGILLLRVSHLTSFLLTYIRTCGRNAVLGIGSLHLVRVARLSSFATLAHSSTHCSSSLILLAGLPLLRIPRLLSFSLIYCSYTLLVCPHSPCWPTSRTCCSSPLILYAGLLLVRVPCLLSFSLPYCSYALLVCSYSPRWPTSCTSCLSALILLPCLHLVRVARLPLCTAVCALYVATRFGMLDFVS